MCIRDRCQSLLEEIKELRKELAKKEEIVEVQKVEEQKKEEAKKEQSQAHFGAALVRMQKFFTHEVELATLIKDRMIETNRAQEEQLIK